MRHGDDGEMYNEDGADTEDNNDNIDDEKVDWASLGRIRRARPPL